MQDSDDYFDDDDLDEETIAVLDAEERKYFQTQRVSQNVPKRNLPQPAVLPPSKRSRIDNGWKTVENSVLGSSQGIPDIPLRTVASGSTNSVPVVQARPGEGSRGITESPASRGNPSRSSKQN